ncbi:MAG: hypothetical protein Q8J78_01490 [Moraxellaceae bacterium]|nr:hypothetical protein [Moraxellaceae bacterium]
MLTSLSSGCGVLSLMRLLVLTLVSLWSLPSYALEEIDDSELSDMHGQSLFVASYAANAGFGFYRLAVDAQLDLNTNIKRLALGCDGAGGTGVCDIDISNLRLTGVGATSAADSGPGRDFMLRRPYLEFAVKNPGNPATREVSGMRFGAYESLGVMSVGENPNINDLNDDTGITRLSGEMNVRVTNATLTNVGVTSVGICCVIGPTTATIASHQQNLVLRRAQTASLTGMSAVAIGLTLNNTNLNNQPLRSIHNIQVSEANGSPTKDFYLGVQKENILWQRVSTGAFAGNPAEKGWWMSIPDVQIPNLTTNQSIRIGTLDVIGGLFGGAVNVNPVDLQQRPVDNCWGPTTFC